MADVEIKLGRETYNLRPTYGAMREIEARCKSSCATLLSLLAKHELHLEEMATIVHFGAAEAGEDFNLETIGKRLFEHGVDTEKVRDPIAEYLTELLWAPDSARKKEVGEWWKANEQITSLTFSLPHTRSDGDPETFGDPLPENSGESSKPSVKKPSKPDAVNGSPKAAE